MRETFSTEFARFAVTSRLAEIPPDVIEAAKDHLLDALGIALAAASLEPAAGWERSVRTLGNGLDSTLLGWQTPAPAASAALLNGTLIHSLEYDDTHTESVIHGSSVVVPTALAVGERQGAMGADLLAAVVAGWELLIRLGLAAPGAFQARGFQTSAVCGPFAAAAIASRLMGSDAETTAHAVGIAGSQASGVFAFLEDGATVKALHPGWAAHAGVVAALMARGGMTGPSNVFEGRFGFFRVYADAPAAVEKLRDLLADGLGTTWCLREAAIKLYPCCHYIHAFLECIERLMSAGLRLEEVDEIVCAVPEEEVPIICDPWEGRIAPASGYEAKFSLPYCLAATLVHGAVDVSTFTGPVSGDVVAVAKQIRYRPVSGSGFPRRFPGSIEVRLRSGTVLREHVEDVQGGAAYPASRDVIRQKFRSNAGRRLAAEAVEAVIQEIDRLDQVDDLGALSRQLRRADDGPARVDGAQTGQVIAAPVAPQSPSR